MLRVIQSMTVKELFDYIVGVILVISIIVEKSKKLPFNPWSKLLSAVGGALLKKYSEESMQKLEKIEAETKANSKAIIKLNKEVHEKFNEQQLKSDEKEAKRLRANIICFSDSCRVGDRHTKNHFENVMRDYDDYIAYCEKHNLENHYIEGEYEYISSIYQKCLRENKFL